MSSDCFYFLLQFSRGFYFLLSCGVALFSCSKMKTRASIHSLSVLSCRDPNPGGGGRMTLTNNDKELSDLLDFSAVSYSIIHLLYNASFGNPNCHANCFCYWFGYLALAITCILLHMTTFFVFCFPRYLFTFQLHYFTEYP